LQMNTCQKKSGDLKTLFSTQQEERQKESRMLFLTLRDRDAEIFVTRKNGNNDYEDGVIYKCKPCTFHNQKSCRPAGLHQGIKM